LCKALPLTDNLRKHLPLDEIFRNEGERYGRLCAAELNYLNSKNIHDKIQDKMQACIYNKQSPYQNFRVDYHLVAKNVEEYNKMLDNKRREIEVNKSNESD
jgi:sporulation protein YlmC with PRC-barrel domain